MVDCLTSAIDYCLHRVHVSSGKPIACCVLQIYLVKMGTDILITNERFVQVIVYIVMLLL